MRRPKPCPFCGSTDIDVQPWHGGAPTKHLVGCNRDNAGCDVAPSVSGETREEAIATWNKRAPIRRTAKGTAKRARKR